MREIGMSEMERDVQRVSCLIESALHEHRVHRSSGPPHVRCQFACTTTDVVREHLDQLVGEWGERLRGAALGSSVARVLVLLEKAASDALSIEDEGVRERYVKAIGDRRGHVSCVLRLLLLEG